ncbi:MAG: hypothetical protein JJE25_05810, partial [Bacteroidia bacterium]|nr:hypothetical protein [Bacteroidia bacterium]
LVHGVLKGGIKKQVSLDMDGNTISGDTGRSYFPGYAINVETGERLNIMFAEDSWLVGENGNDMKWNPTSGFFTPLNTPLLGGKHFIYVVNANHNPPSATYAMNGYDGCDSIQKLLLTGTSVNVARVYRNVSWVGFPLLLPGQQLLSNDVKIRLRVTRAYQQFGTGTPVADGNLVTGQTYIVQDGKIKHNGIDYSSISSFTAINPNYTIVAPATSALVLTTVNNGNPMYTFSTDDLFNDNNNLDAAKSALDLINVVPNPYYAYSGYEGSLSGGVVVQPQLDNRIKIVNLPPKCVVSIYTVSGILVRKFSRDVAADNSPGAPISAKNFETSQDWDLKNHKGVPIASGLYLIHVEAAGIGERTLKWFGVMRPIDLDSF